MISVVTTPGVSAFSTSVKRMLRHLEWCVCVCVCVRVRVRVRVRACVSEGHISYSSS